MTHFVYLAIGRRQQFLYAGVTSNLASRIQAHRKQPWFRMTAWWHVIGPLERSAALFRERQWIIAAEPAYNSRGRLNWSFDRKGIVRDIDPKRRLTKWSGENLLWKYRVTRQRVQQILSRP